MEQKDTQVPESTPELDRLLKERHFLGRRMLMMLFENVIVFGAPAGIAVWIGLRYEMLVIALVVAFTLSWLIFFANYRQVLKRVNEVDEKIKAERERAGIPHPEAPGFPPLEEENEEDEEEKY